MISKSLILLLAGTTAQAATVHPLDEMKVIGLPISQQGLTRIKVQNDRILHVFGNAGEYVLETDEDQGQVFIRPTLLNDSSAKAISLTLTTEAGHTQDLRLTPKNQAPEALILKVDTEATSKAEKEKRSSSPLFREEAESLIFALQEDRIPLGYKEMPINLTTLHEPYPLLRELQGKTLRGLIYRIQNKTPENLILSEPELAKQLSLQQNTLVAILISKKILTPGEGTEAYVVVQAN
ncbi:MAG: type-F conjugative transfer system secretin TraK [Alphaproteobacteria bacterium]|nr:type-F conjugative transfer system secretin TraK [Alphaproteobacteria bacterium]